MHITQITLSNFRSFRHSSDTSSSSSSTHNALPQSFAGGALNCVIGRNGSGKSNLFDAVQFVLLAPRFVNLRPDERVALLHEGSGSAAVTAYVEICLDNADGRLPFDAQQVVLRRTIGVSKDEFFLQRQRCSKSEVQSLLEGAGFSKSNPYYIVQQGKVQDLCTMRDDARLQLLKEVAGTTVYDARKASSLTQMVENATNRAQITDLLADLQTRLEALQAEQAELVQYQRLDKSRRALEYSLYDKEWIKARALLESCEEERARHAQDLQGLDEAAKEIHDMIRNTEASVAAHATGRQRNARLLANQQEDFFASVQHLAAQGLQLAELREALAAATSAQASNAGALEDLTQQIATHQASLESRVTPAWQAATQALEGSKTNKATVDQKIQGLYAKQGRGRHFESVADRDVFLQQRLDELETQRVAQEQQQSQEAERLAHLRRSVQENDQERGDLASQVTKHSHDHESLTKTLEEQNRARQECQEERKMVWRQRETLQDQVREARDALGKATADSKKTTPRATALGLEALKTIVEQEGLVQGEHYFGAVVDNFQMRDAKYQTAVEVAAQNALFHVIVDTDETASRLLRKLEEGRLGRVTFLPLEQLRLEKSFLPTNNPDVRPLLEHCLEFDPKVERALRHVFGKKLLCRSMDLATEWSKKLGVDGITLDGDLCSRKGSMTGGYVDLSKSRLRAYESQRTALAKLAELEGESRKVEHEAQKTEQQLNAFMQEVQRLGAKHAQLGNLVTQKDAKVDRLDQKKLQTLKSIETVEKTTMPPLLRELATCEKEMERLREEIGTELVETLSEEDRTLLEELKGTQAELQADIQTQTDNVSKVSLERQKLQSMLHDNLFKRRRELLDSAKGRSIVDEDDEHRASHAGASFAASIAQKRDELEELEREIDEAKRVKEQIQARSDEARVTDQRLQEEESKARNDLEQLRGEDMQYAKRFEEAQTKSERMLNKRSMYMSKRETYQRKIQELGSLPPPSEIEKFSGKSISELMKTLDGINKKLKAYSHVNKKAFDQYVNFNEQRESLLKRKEELDQGAAKVEELIENLDRQKDEAINRTFRDVSKHFKDVFKELVPNGEGELILKTAMDEELEEDESEDEAGPAKGSKEPDVSLYRGIAIKVQFAASGETYMMSQLSGGQKALVALTMIFAIQRCDPAPFYLFDELDQALDSTYRSAVANLIKKQSRSEEHPTQFIVSTFRPELVDGADRWFGISHQNKVSNLHPLSKKDALHFVANLMNEEEAVGDVTSLATSKTSRRSLASRKRKTLGAAADKGDDDDSPEMPKTGRLSAPM